MTIKCEVLKFCNTYLTLYLVKLITSSVEDDSAKVSKPSVHKPFPYLWHIVTLEVAISLGQEWGRLLGALARGTDDTGINIQIVP